MTFDEYRGVEGTTPRAGNHIGMKVAPFASSPQT
jgi:hypothetical protein